jgi:hypothetical protein
MLCFICEMQLSNKFEKCWAHARHPNFQDRNKIHFPIDCSLFFESVSNLSESSVEQSREEAIEESSEELLSMSK